MRLWRFRRAHQLHSGYLCGHVHVYERMFCSTASLFHFQVLRSLNVFKARNILSSLMSGPLVYP